MYIYVIPYVLILFVGVLTLFYKFSLNSAKIVFLLGLLPGFFLVIFRGNVGVDTEAYESIIGYYNNTGICTVEPLFCTMSKFIYELTDRSDYILRFITALFCILFFFAFSKTKNEIVITSFFVYPVFFYDMSMNGIRYGLAFILFKLLYDGLTKKSILTIPIYVSIQISSFILLLLSLINKMNYKIFLFIIVLLFIIILFLGEDFFMKKFLAYSESMSTNYYSGFLNFFVGVLIVLVLKLNNKIPIKEFLIYIFIFIIFQTISYFSYAGLRFVSLMIFFIGIRIMIVTETKNLKLNKKIYVLLFLVGLILYLNMLRSMYLSEKYLPYDFIF